MAPATCHIYFVSTTGGAQGSGQVWMYKPTDELLVMMYESPRHAVLDMPDNITMSPHGWLVLCENGENPIQRLHGLTRGGEIIPFAENNIVLNGTRGFTGDYLGQEWAGNI